MMQVCTAHKHSYTEKGFVVNSVHMDGAVMACGTLFTLWDVQSMQDVSPDSLSLLLLLRPPPGVSAAFP